MFAVFLFVAIRLSVGDRGKLGANRCPDNVFHLAPAHFFSDDEMVALFNLEGIGKSASRFDFTKLENMNGHYIRAADDKRLVSAIDDILGEADCR